MSGDLLGWLGALDGEELLHSLLRVFPGSTAVMSSFGAESAVLLDLVARVKPDLPILTIDTGRLFPETIAYRDMLVARLGLTGLRLLKPDPAAALAEDADGELWFRDPDACCALRKVAPLKAGAAGFTVLIDGRKRFHGNERATISTVQWARGIIEASPLATWDEARIERAFVERDLPRHPLVARGIRSIGCLPCTSPVGEGDSVRAGRWSGRGKTECGIHTTNWTRT